MHEGVTRHCAVSRGSVRSVPAFAFAVAIVAAPALRVAAADAPANKASGTLKYKTTTLALKYAYLVRGPDVREIDSKHIIRRLIFSPTDIGAQVQACTTMSCADVKEGMEVDFDQGPRLNYWVTVNNQLVQYSGTVVPEAFTARVNDAKHIAGKLSVDDTGAGGPRVDVDFDATLFKEFKAAR